MEQESKYRKIRNSVNDFATKYHLDAFREVGLFIFILLVLHLLWRFWAVSLHYNVLGMYTEPVRANDWLVNLIVKQSAWFIRHVLTIAFSLNGSTFHFSNNTYLNVSISCSGLKQIYEFTGLMIFYPGPWRKKAWFIPAGIIIIHITNLFRITGLSVVLQNYPEYWKWLHDWAFRPFFYVVMFSLWVWWIEKLAVIKPGGLKNTASKDIPVN